MQVLIDNEPYIKLTDSSSGSIGVGITTHNRNKLVSQTVSKIKQYTPNAKIIVVDDASEHCVEIPGVDVYHFKTNVGIARAKNKCLELLSDCEHIFLFDDDTYPICNGWTDKYINSPEHHLMYLFKDWSNGRPVGDDCIVYRDDNHLAHDHARGCMIYIDRLVLDTVGGMDTRFGKAMNEHIDWSMRIHNAGLTTFRYMDVIGSEQLIYSMDQHQEVSTSITDRRSSNEQNSYLLNESETSKEFIPYGKDIVIACYFAGVTDVQRNNSKWQPDINAIDNLRRSVEKRGLEFVLIHNCFDLPNKVSISSSPYFERWLKEWEYLRDRRDINRVFLVDATDVDMVYNPFSLIEYNKLYVGYEVEQKLNSAWMLARHREPNVNSFLRDNGDKQLLNCGVVGGDRHIIMDLCRDIYLYHFNYPQDQTEMGIFNRLLYTKYADRFEYGSNITSKFKYYERTTNAWFRHK